MIQNSALTCPCVRSDFWIVADDSPIALVPTALQRPISWADRTLDRLLLALSTCFAAIVRGAVRGQPVPAWTITHGHVTTIDHWMSRAGSGLVPNHHLHIGRSHSRAESRRRSVRAGQDETRNSDQCEPARDADPSSACARIAPSRVEFSPSDGGAMYYSRGVPDSARATILNCALMGAGVRPIGRGNS